MQASNDPIKEIHDISTSLLEVDGSCRDLNFENPTWSGVGEMLRSLVREFEVTSILDSDGTELPIPSKASVQTLASAGGHARLRGGAFVNQLQVFIFREIDGSPFVELTFFPQDVVRSDDVRGDFIRWVESLMRQLAASRFYARYENASWQFGDCGPQSDVFAVSGESNADA